MTLQEFSTLHPKVIHYERVGVEGLDLEALHERIEKSRYLKSRQSFVYLAKNYKDILAGKFDDFKLEIEPEKPKHDERTLLQIEKLKQCLSVVRALPDDGKISKLCVHTLDLSDDGFGMQRDSGHSHAPLYIRYSQLQNSVLQLKRMKMKLQKC